MASVTEMRDWLRDHGEDVPLRGKLSAEWVEKYEAANGDLPLPDPDDDPGDDGDLIGADDLPPMVEEVRPSRPRTRQRPAERASAAGDRLIGRILGGSGKAAAKPKAKGKPKPRVSLESLVTRSYEGIGRVLAPLSPAAAACIGIQAPMAGVILEDKLRGTIADRALQPVARAEDLMNAGFALIAPPIACMGIEMTWMQEQTPQVVFRRTVLMQVLREGLRTGLEVSEKYGEQIAEATAKRARYEGQVDELIAMIFPPPKVEDVPEQEMAGAAA